MANPADLLRLLEPVVRPAGLPPGASPTAVAPPTAQRFEDLLAQQSAAPSAPAAADDSPAPGSRGTPVAEAPAGDRPHGAASPLSALAGIDRIENPGLRALLGQRAA